MEPSQLKDFDKEYLIRTCQLWGISTIPLPKQISDVESLIFSGYIKNKKIAIRLTHLKHRTLPLIFAEMDWIHFLSSNGVAVVALIRSHSGRFVEEVIINGITWLACVFDWVEGKLANALNIQGYQQVYSLDPTWFDQLPIFFHLRDLDLMLMMIHWRQLPANRWFMKIKEHYEHGHPMKTFPWKDWAKKAVSQINK